MTKDYDITVQDSTGRTCDLWVNGASIDEWIANGYSIHEAHEAARNQAFENAVREGEIGADAWVIAEGQ